MRTISTTNIPDYSALYVAFCMKYGTGIFPTYAKFVEYIRRYS